MVVCITLITYTLTCIDCTGSCKHTNRKHAFRAIIETLSRLTGKPLILAIVLVGAIECFVDITLATYCGHRRICSECKGLVVIVLKRCFKYCSLGLALLNARLNQGVVELFSISKTSSCKDLSNIIFRVVTVLQHLLKSRSIIGFLACTFQQVRPIAHTHRILISTE